MNVISETAISNEFTTWWKDTPDSFITHIKNALKSSLGKMLSWVYYFQHKTLNMVLVAPKIRIYFPREIWIWKILNPDSNVINDRMLSFL